MDPFELTPEEEMRLDQELSENEIEDLPEGWVHVTIAMPQDFYEIYHHTLTSYMKLRESEKPFPGFEAMVMEARNSLPNDEEALE
jgi:hypothetical protein